MYGIDGHINLKEEKKIKRASLEKVESSNSGSRDQVVVGPHKRRPTRYSMSLQGPNFRGPRETYAHSTGKEN